MHFVSEDRNHLRHSIKWTLHDRSSTRPGGMRICVACVLETLEDAGTALVKKSFGLTNLIGILKSLPGAIREMFNHEQELTVCFLRTLLGLIQNLKDKMTEEKAVQALVQLLIELQNESSFHLILEEINKRLCNQKSLKPFLPMFTFLGNLLKAVPNIAQSIMTQHTPLLEHLCCAFLCPDEELKNSVTLVWTQLLTGLGDAANQFLPVAIRDRVCVLLMQTFANTSSEQLVKNCGELLWIILQKTDSASVLMNYPANREMDNVSEDTAGNNSQTLNQDQQPSGQCYLPLLLKKLLICPDESLQLTAARCISAVLVHNPILYSNPFFKADILGFLFDRLVSGKTDMLVWCVYSCLLLLTENPAFFTQCHTVYGIESVFRSLMHSLSMTEIQVSKQGFTLLREILLRQPEKLSLFRTAPEFALALETIIAGVECPYLAVATQATSAATNLLRLNHQPRPVLVKELERLVESISKRLPEIVSSGPHQNTNEHLRQYSTGQPSQNTEFLKEALNCFQAVCRLAMSCASDPTLIENPFSAPNNLDKPQNELESLCVFLLNTCDISWIPTVLVRKTPDAGQNVAIMESYYFLLSSMYTLVPSQMDKFSDKLASSGFIKQTLELKKALCSGNRNAQLNELCSNFLQKLCMCLLTQSDSSSKNDLEEVENLLESTLPSLCFSLSDWPSLFWEHENSRATQFCMLIVLHLSVQNEDRFLPDHVISPCVVGLLKSIHEQGNCVLPCPVLRSALYLLAVTQHKAPSLDGVTLNYISKALSSCQSLSSIYFHHRALLHFICRYKELAEKFGIAVLKMWLTNQTQPTDEGRLLMEEIEVPETGLSNDHENKPDSETMEMLTLLEMNPKIVYLLLEMVSQEADVAERVVGVLEVALTDERTKFTVFSGNLEPVLLELLQHVCMETAACGLGQGLSERVNSVPFLLRVLCVLQTTNAPSSLIDSNMEGVQFKLLYQVSNIVGMLEPTNTKSLQLAFNYLYCCLSLSPAHSTDRVVSMLLSNNGLMSQLQTAISSSSASPSFPSSARSCWSLECCSHLLLSSLIILQRVHSTQVQKNISWDLKAAILKIFLQKKSRNYLLHVSYLRFLGILLDFDLKSQVVCVSTGPGLIGGRPLSLADGTLYPLGIRGVQFLLTALNGFLLQKHDLLMRASVNCLSSLLSFMKRRSPFIAKRLVSTPWSRLLLYLHFSSGENWCLHPAILKLVTVLLQHSVTVVQWEPYLLQALETMEKMEQKELSEELAQIQKLHLIQIQSSLTLLKEDHRQRVGKRIEELEAKASEGSYSTSESSKALCIGNVHLCRADFAL